MKQDIESKRFMIDLYDSNVTKIHEIMNEKNRSAAYVSNALIQEALVQRGNLKEVDLKL